MSSQSTPPNPTPFNVKLVQPNTDNFPAGTIEGAKQGVLGIGGPSQTQAVTTPPGSPGVKPAAVPTPGKTK